MRKRKLKQIGVTLTMQYKALAKPYQLREKRSVLNTVTSATVQLIFKKILSFTLRFFKISMYSSRIMFEDASDTDFAKCRISGGPDTRYPVI